MPSLTVKELSYISGTLGNLMGAKVEVHTAFKLRKFINVAMKALREAEEKKNELIKTYGSIIPNSGGQYQVTDEGLSEYHKELDVILSKEVGLPDITIRLSSLEKAGLSVGDIANLDFILDQEDTGEKSNIIPV